MVLAVILPGFVVPGVPESRSTHDRVSNVRRHCLKLSSRNCLPQTPVRFGLTTTAISAASITPPMSTADVQRIRPETMEPPPVAQHHRLTARNELLKRQDAAWTCGGRRWVHLASSTLRWSAPDPTLAAISRRRRSRLSWHLAAYPWPVLDDLPYRRSLTSAADGLVPSAVTGSYLSSRPTTRTSSARRFSLIPLTESGLSSLSRTARDDRPVSTPQCRRSGRRPLQRRRPPVMGEELPAGFMNPPRPSGVAVARHMSHLARLA